MVTILKYESLENIDKNKTTNWNIAYHPIINSKVNVSSVNYYNNYSNDYMPCMFNIFFEYIRNNLLLNQTEEFVSDNYVAQNYNDIYYNKKDGYWIVINEYNKVMTLYKRTTYPGYIYNTYEIKFLFTLSIIVDATKDTQNTVSAVSSIKYSLLKQVPPEYKQTSIDFVEELKKKLSIRAQAAKKSLTNKLVSDSASKIIDVRAINEPLICNVSEANENNAIINFFTTTAEPVATGQSLTIMPNIESEVIRATYSSNESFEEPNIYLATLQSNNLVNMSDLEMF